MAQIFGILSAVALVFVAVPYYIDIVRGNSKPQRMAMVIFMVLATIAFFGQQAEGATSSLWFAGFIVLNQFNLLLLSFKYGMGGASNIDKISLVLAVSILGLWYLTSSAALAIVLVIFVDAIGKALVCIKVYKHPHTELLFAWAMATVASIFGTLAVGELDIILLLFPGYNIISIGLVVWLIYTRQKATPKDAASKEPKPTRTQT